MEPLSMRKVLHEAFTDGAHLLLLGGVLVAARARELRHGRASLGAFGILMPLFNAVVALTLAITFPFNIVIGLPLYLWALERFWS